MSGGSFITTSITERRIAGTSVPPPTVSLKRMSPENKLSVDDERKVVLGVARGRKRLDAETAYLERARDDLDAELAFVRDVIGSECVRNT